MSRQIQICTTPVDDLRFLKYLQDNFDCAFFQSFSFTGETVWIEDLKDLHDPNDTVKIWNRDFPWNPLYSATSRDQLVYISNTSCAPILIFERTNWETLRCGRVYWLKEISPTSEYHVIYFEKFYNKVAQWFQKNASGKGKWNGANVYYMNDAWKRFVQLNTSQPLAGI